MCWAGLLQVGCVWEPSVAAQIFGPSLERGVWRSSESSVAPVLDLRAGFLGSSELPSLERSGFFFARSRTSWLEREFSESGRSSDQAFARARVFYVSG